MFQLKQALIERGICNRETGYGIFTRESGADTVLTSYLWICDREGVDCLLFTKLEDACRLAFALEKKEIQILKFFKDEGSEEKF